MDSPADLGVRPTVASWEIRALGLLLVLFAGVLASLAWRTGVTVDEPAHLLSAHLYWKGEDTLHPGDMPPAIKIAGGWVSHFFSLPVPYDRPDLWARRSEWDIAQVMMERLGSPLVQRLFFFSRLPLILFPMLGCVTLWWWARRLFSPRTAIVLAVLFSVCPTVLGHGALFKNDLAASFGYLLFWYRAWVYWREPSRINAAWFGIGLLAALLAKMSMLVLVPLTPLILLCRYLASSPRSWRPAASHLAIVLLVTYAGIAAAWQFRIGVISSSEIQTAQANLQIPRWLPAAAQVLRVIPTPARLRQGAVSLVESNASGTGVYLLGRVYPYGHPSYFLVALATKVPVPLLCLICTALILLGLDFTRRRLQIADCLWLIPPLLYLAMASMSSIQLGVRLILPAIAGLILMAGRTVEFLLKRSATAAVLCLLLTWSLAQSALQYPDYIAYFNSIAGGSDKGIRYLSDSNLDWGQDLRALAAYLEKHSIPNIRLAYFGNDNPYAHIPEARFVQIAPPWHESLVSGPRLQPESGYYAISATLLTGQLFQPRYRDYYRAFREATPVAKAGYSIFVYKVP